VLVIGCGILQRELALAATTYGLKFDTRLLSPSLHLDPSKLERQVKAQLVNTAQQDARVFFGSCHPNLDQWLAAAGRRRTRGTNCIEMLLGPTRYEHELSTGAYFLIEPWARGFTAALKRSFGDRPRVAREIFQGAHSRMLAIRTPCSGDFNDAAEAAAREVGLPLEWTTVDLSELAEVMQDLLAE
jgi:hypothetical protein